MRSIVHPHWTGLLLLALLPGTILAQSEGSDLYGSVPPFTLKERNGQEVRLEDLRGKVWIASFVLIRCPDGKCPQVTRTVQRLQQELASRKDVRFVTFTVDPERDTPEELQTYAEAHQADPERWLFLTGSEETIEEFGKAFAFRSGKEKKGELPHTQRLYVIDRQGNIRGAYQGIRRMTGDTALDEEWFEQDLRKLKKQVDRLLAPELPAWMPSDFPAFNASLNALASVLLLLGYIAIRLRLVRLHISCMVTTIFVSALFLASYLFYHIAIKQGQPTRFSEQWPQAPEWVGYLYLAILGSHTLLAIPVTPLALYVAYLGLRDRLQKHVWLARWVFPVWLYVSVTGVVVYWMLYRLYPTA